MTQAPPQAGRGDEDDDCEPEEPLDLVLEIAKNSAGQPVVDEDQRLVFGWLSVVTKDGQLVVDRQGHVIDPPSLRPPPTTWC